MLIGAQVTAPDGFGPLAHGVTYHFVVNAGPTILLAQFDSYGKNTRQPTASLLRLPRDIFEDGLDRNAISVSRSDAADLPPWLEELKGKNIMAIDARRPSGRRSYLEYVQSRLMHLARALDNLDAIFAEPDIDYAINQFANDASPPQNRGRFRFWLLVYLCFGRNMWALLPPFHRLGRQAGKYSDVKLGAPSKANGKFHGYAMTPHMVELCVKGYLKYGAAGVTMKVIYTQTMKFIFGCKTRRDQDGCFQYYQPNGEPFPSSRQFRYWVTKELSLETVQRTRFGSARHRRSLRASNGRYSEEVSNVLEITEFDGYFTSELPKGYIEGRPLPPLCVVVARDNLCGVMAGIGFSFAERASAYRMALFSMAVPKSYFCELFGIELKDDYWICEGLPPHLKLDRGPGSTPTLVRDDNVKPVIRDMVPSWSGQSKATVESSHPRDVKLEGRPSYVLSGLTPVELAKREILRLMGYNHQTDMSARMEIDPDLAHTLPTPHELYKHYSARLRNSGLPVSIAEAVRSFLTPIPVFAKKDGVYLDDRRFDCAELRDTGLLDKIARNSLGSVELQGYMLDLCVRHIWVEVDSTIIRLDAKLKIRDDESLLFVSIEELKQWREARARVNAKFEEHRSAAAAEMMESFEESTGEKWTVGQRKSGPAKKDRQETKEANRHVSGRKSA